MSIDLTQIILGIITVLSGIVIRYLVPLIKEKTSENQMSILLTAVDVAVYAAEQIFKGEEGEKKKEYVVRLLAEKGYDINMADIDAMIEAAVKNLKMKLQEKDE